jgi:hypothetical protein
MSDRANAADAPDELLGARLRTLSEHGRKAQEAMASWEARDDAAHLAAGKRDGWARFLSSIATTESIEDSLIQPLFKAFSGDAATEAYLETHAADERRHFGLITGYVKRSFDFVKTRRSLMDRIVYDTILPRIAFLGERRPLFFVGILRFYEAFSLDFYKTLRRLAERDRLPVLLQLIQAIEKDELRHLAGLEALGRALRARQGAPSRAELLVVRGILELLLFDINTRAWALHNRRVRRTVLSIGLDPDEMARDARKAAARTIELLRSGG